MSAKYYRGGKKRAGYPKPTQRDRGLGDTVERVTKATGIHSLVEKYKQATGKDCGCGKRKKTLNDLFPYGNANK
tara:strand:- start:1311 stop:1532 length:222 start_codon:yes stop_codon:yes gene_type:complete